MLLTLVGLAGLASASLSTSAAAARGEIRFGESTWRPGSVPSLTFTISTGRGTNDKVVAFLYTSEEPHAFQTAKFPPQFVGVFVPPAVTRVRVDRPPERGPITEHSRERFVQGALFDLRSGLIVGLTNEAYIDIKYSAEPTVYTLNFKTEDDFATPLVNGQDISTPPEFGDLVSLSARQPGSGPLHKGPAIFDSNPTGPNAASSDPDLLVGLGNVLILQENAGQTVPGIFDLPDDAANGGTFVIDFSGFSALEKVELRSIDLIDVDASATGVKVSLFDVLGNSRGYTVPPQWTEDIHVNGPPGYRTLDLTSILPQVGFHSTTSVTTSGDFLSDEVVKMEIAMGGSGAIDNIVFAREVDPTAGLGESSLVPPVKER